MGTQYEYINPIHTPLPLIELPPPIFSNSRRSRSRYNDRCNIINHMNNCIRSTNRMIFNTTNSQVYYNTDEQSCPSYTVSFNSINNMSSMHHQHQHHPHEQSSIDHSLYQHTPSSAVLRSLTMIRRDCERMYYAGRHLSDSDISSISLQSFDTYIKSYPSISDDPFISSSSSAAAAASQSSPSSTSGPVPIIADNVSLPMRAGTVDITKVLPKHLLKTFSKHLELLLLPPEQRRRAPSMAIPHYQRKEYAKLIKLMEQAGMVALSTAQPIVINGVFCIPKAGSNNELRLILDARPANATMEQPPWFALPTPDILSKLIPTSSEPIFIAKCDVSNFFHMLRVPSEWSEYFGLPFVWSNEVGINDVPPYKIWPRCTTLPMGWAYSPYLAQLIHEHIIINKGWGKYLINEHNDMFINDLRMSIYIDDMTFMGHNYQLVHDTQLEYEHMMEHQYQLPTKQSKRVPPSTKAEVIGLEMDGISHSISLSYPKLFKLIHDTQQIIRIGCITGQQLQHIVGRWTWAALVRRPALSSFNAVYAFGRSNMNRRRYIWPSCIRELNTICGLSPLLYCQLTTRYSPWVIATDASMDGMGITYANVPYHVQSSLQSHSVQQVMQQRQHRKISNNVNRITTDTDPQLLQHQYEQSRIKTLMDSHPHHEWNKITSSEWKYMNPDTHINELEARAVKTSIIWLRSRPITVGSNVTMLTDSSVVMSALQRGRSSARSIRVVIRSIAGHLLAGGINLHTHWIPSHVNPSDYYSRHFNHHRDWSSGRQWGLF